MNIVNITRNDEGLTFVLVEELDEDFDPRVPYVIEGVDPGGFDGVYRPVGLVDLNILVFVEDDPGVYVSGGTITKED